VKRSPLRNKTPLRRKTPLRASNRFPSKGDPGAATAANEAVPVSMEALRFPKPTRARHPRGANPKVGGNHGPRAAKKLLRRVGADAQPLVAPEGQHDAYLPKFPKPAPRVKAARAPIKRSWMRKGARGTKHSRRPREWGYMAFCHARGCELYLDVATQGMLGFQHHCQGRLEFAHLSDKKRYDVGDVGACLCQTTHKGIDGKVGGKAPWYVALDRTGQRMIRMRLADRARRDWDALTPAQRAHWDDVGELRRKELRAA
jgi:alkylhydroperoxidase/carboxymuconolactone decarboxylase family protein YurZ